MMDEVFFRRKEVIGTCTLYLGDNMAVMPELTHHDCLLTDPPYGIGWSSTSYKAEAKRTGDGKLVQRRDYGSFDWDSEPASAECISFMRSLCRHQIIFGGNYFDLPPSRCWLVWDKMNGTTKFADCELAWTSLDTPVRRIQWLWNGFASKGSDERIHPTQKPLGVMSWCLDQLPDGVETVLDPFMGSGTTGAACLKAGLKFTGIERDDRYFDGAVARLRKQSEQGQLL
ncbi:MAG: site-specific DNA-methyltransferase [Epibacterium sp.]|nr:site-specific DNA-methyltransferase [Epibacterium sp.]NQX73712.1 site-specific DNA-methyltransferase [Epibacterium sp.]